jgi:hypothetical protein
LISIKQLNFKAPEKSHASQELVGYSKISETAVGQEKKKVCFDHPDAKHDQSLSAELLKEDLYIRTGQYRRLTANYPSHTGSHRMTNSSGTII